MQAWHGCARQSQQDVGDVAEASSSLGPMQWAMAPAALMLEGCEDVMFAKSSEEGPAHSKHYLTPRRGKLSSLPSLRPVLIQGKVLQREGHHRGSRGDPWTQLPSRCLVP